MGRRLRIDPSSRVPLPGQEEALRVRRRARDVTPNAYVELGARTHFSFLQAASSPEALVAMSPEQDAMVQLTAPGKGTPDEAVKQFVGQEGVKTGQVSSAQVNGLPAASTEFEAQTEQGAIQGVVSFIKYGELTYRILGYTPAGKLQTYGKTFGSTINSFSELTDKARLDVQPFKVELVKVNVDENPRTATKLGVQSIPTLIVLRGPLEVDRIVGALSKTDFDLRLDRVV